MKAKTVFFCTECGNESPKWSGRCSACGAWNSMVEQVESKTAKGSRSAAAARAVKASPITEIDTAEEIRFSTGMGELDRVLGGGAVKGSLVLVGGAPGIGKSTLMLQICRSLGEFAKVLYVSGEESAHQLKLRAQRLQVESAGLFVLSETCLGNILECVQQEKPDILIVDSIQTLYDEELDSPAGGVGQVKDCTMALMQLAKGQGITVFVIGHVNKEGSIAGPKVLEHMVDCVLYFEGDQHMTYRILRAAKNRFGATNEIGVFEMMDRGLKEVENPSEMLLSGRPADAPGTCVTCVMEGARPVLAEVQALIAPSSGSKPLRSSNGFDYNRAAMLLAVLEKRGGLKVSQCDAYLNIIGGLTLDEPAADLAAVMAIASSYLDKPIAETMAAMGEVGLSGEIRAVSHLEQRLSEAQRLGLEIVGHMRSYCDRISKERGMNYTLIATPAEGLSGRFVRMDRARYGVIPGVTDRDYYTNGFHVPVYFDISAFDKIALEAPYHALTNGGHISYIELDGDPSDNLEAFESVIRYMKDCGMGYGSVNHPVDRDPVCGYNGIIEDVCPKCGRTEDEHNQPFERIRRITGYLVGTLDRFNDAKRAEEHDRVKHDVPAAE